jgi:hypothetical protein
MTKGDKQFLMVGASVMPVIGLLGGVKRHPEKIAEFGQDEVGVMASSLVPIFGLV